MKIKKVFEIKSTDELFELFHTEKLVRKELDLGLFNNEEYPGVVDKSHGFHIILSLRYSVEDLVEIVSMELPIKIPFKLIRDENGTWTYEKYKSGK